MSDSEALRRASSVRTSRSSSPTGSATSRTTPGSSRSSSAAGPAGRRRTCSSRRRAGARDRRRRGRALVALAQARAEGHGHRALRPAADGPVSPGPDRCARAGGSAGRSCRGAGSGRRRGADDLLQPGLGGDGGVRGSDGRGSALVPALLEHLERPRRELREEGGGLRLRGDRRHPGHDDAGLAPARPRPRVSSLPARQGHRPVHGRPGLQRAGGVGGSRRRPAERSNHRGRGASSRAARARLPRLLLVEPETCRSSAA